jgi:hypothetical protein
MAPANTGRLTIRRTAVIATDHKNRGRRDKLKLVLIRETKIVVKKLILPRIDEMPARWRLKIARSTEIPVWNFLSERGG